MLARVVAVVRSAGGMDRPEGKTGGSGCQLLERGGM